MGSVQSPNHKSLFKKRLAVPKTLHYNNDLYKIPLHNIILENLNYIHGRHGAYTSKFYIFFGVENIVIFGVENTLIFEDQPSEMASTDFHNMILTTQGDVYHSGSAKRNFNNYTVFQKLEIDLKFSAIHCGIDHSLFLYTAGGLY